MQLFRTPVFDTGFGLSVKIYPGLSTKIIIQFDVDKTCDAREIEENLGIKVHHAIHRFKKSRRRL